MKFFGGDSRFSKFEVDTDRALKNQINSILLSYIRNEHYDFSITHLTQAYLILSTAQSQFKAEASQIQRHVYSEMIRKLDVSEEKLESLEILLENKKTAFPEANLDFEIQEIRQLRERVDQRSSFLALEALVFGGGVNETTRIDIQNLLMPKILNYFRSLQNKTLTLQQAQTASLRALVLCQYFAQIPQIQPDPVCLEELTKTRQYSSEDESIARTSLDVLLDLESELEKQKNSQVLESIASEMSQYFRITEKPLSVRIFESVANLSLQTLSNEKRLLDKICSLGRPQIALIFSEQSKVSSKVAEIEQIWNSFKRCLQEMIELSHLKEKQDFQAEKQNFKTMLSILKFLLSRSGSAGLLKMEISQLCGLISRNFQKKLERIENIKQEEQKDSDQIMNEEENINLLKQFYQSKSQLLQIWKIVKISHFRNQELQSQIYKWIQFYQSCLEEESSLAQRIYPIHILVDLNIKDHDLFSEYFQEITQLTLYHVQNMVSLLDSSLSLIEPDLQFREPQLDFVVSKYLKHSHLYMQLSPQYSLTLDAISKYFKLLSSKTTYSSTQLSLTLELLDLLMSSKEASELVLQCFLSSSQQLHFALQTKDTLINVRDQFLKLKEDELFSSMSPTNYLLSSFFKDKNRDSQIQSGPPITVQGIDALISQIQFLQNYLNLILNLNQPQLEHLLQVANALHNPDQLENAVSGLSEAKKNEILQILGIQNENPLFDQFSERSKEEQVERNVQILRSKGLRQLRQ